MILDERRVTIRTTDYHDDNGMVVESECHSAAYSESESASDVGLEGDDESESEIKNSDLD
jgi:hypothetical protein